MRLLSFSYLVPMNNEIPMCKSAIIWLGYTYTFSSGQGLKLLLRGQLPLAFSPALHIPGNAPERFMRFNAPTVGLHSTPEGPTFHNTRWRTDIQFVTDRSDAKKNSFTPTVIPLVQVRSNKPFRDLIKYIFSKFANCFVKVFPPDSNMWCFAVVANLKTIVAEASVPNEPWHNIVLYRYDNIISIF